MLHIEARDYSAYKYESSISGEMLDPIKYKMLHGDTCEDGKPIYCSPWRTQPVPGIIILGKTYGSWKGKLLYKFIPDCKHLPFFLVPYELKASFSKAHKNKYAVITFKEWTLQSPSSFPLGTLTETIGDVDSLEAFCEYQLHRRNLVVSMNKFTNRVKSILADEKACIQTILETSKYNIQDYRNQKYIFSIDPDSCTDFDDAFSVSCADGVATVTVFIANVYVWLETFGLFAYLTNRVSTIYLPDKKRPMLPSLLSDNYCSLKQGCDRFAFAYQQQFNMDTMEPVSEPRFFNAIIKVNKNCTYEDSNLNNMPGYAALKTLSSKEDSHDVVAYWMIKMNVECAKVLSKPTDKVLADKVFNKGIYRGSESMRASYSLEPMRHDALNEIVYTHITSPIRRLVDVLNQICFNANVSADAAEFYNTWSLNLNHVNAQTKAIKRAQMDCDLLAFSMNHNESECIGTIVDILDDGEYCVQLHTNRCMVRYKSAEIYDTGSQHTFKLLVFNDEHTLCKKVRLIMI